MLGRVISRRRSSVNAASLEGRYALGRISMQARDVNRARRPHGLAKIPLQGTSQMRRLTNALEKKPDYQLRRNIQFTRHAPRYVAAVAAASEYAVQHLHVFGCETGCVNRGRHEVLLSVRAKLTASISSARSMAAETFNLRLIMHYSK